MAVEADKEDPAAAAALRASENCVFFVCEIRVESSCSILSLISRSIKKPSKERVEQILTFDCLRCVAAGKPPAVVVPSVDVGVVDVVEVEALPEIPVLRRSTTSPTSSKGCWACCCRGAGDCCCCCCCCCG